jgi:hypothetical protein
MRRLSGALSSWARVRSVMSITEQTRALTASALMTGTQTRHSSI